MYGLQRRTGDGVIIANSACRIFYCPNQIIFIFNHSSHAPDLHHCLTMLSTIFGNALICFRLQYKAVSPSSFYRIRIRSSPLTVLSQLRQIRNVPLTCKAVASLSFAASGFAPSDKLVFAKENGYGKQSPNPHDENINPPNAPKVFTLLFPLNSSVDCTNSSVDCTNSSVDCMNMFRNLH